MAAMPRSFKRNSVHIVERDFLGGPVVKLRRACRGMVRDWRAPNMRPCPIRKARATIGEIDETNSPDVQ
jgi:hypothetical protein